MPPADKLRRLYDKAARFVSGARVHAVALLYRDKPLAYWQAECSRGTAEQPYRKSHSGHHYCPLTVGGQRGLYFKAQRHGSLASSPFGDRRRLVPAGALLDERRHCLYFADFYCNSPGATTADRPMAHYVTLAVALRGSPEDAWCAQHLPALMLSYRDNPFIYYAHRGSAVVCIDVEMASGKGSCWVELFYMHEVPFDWSCYDEHGCRVSDSLLGALLPVAPYGRGQSHGVAGVPNDTRCTWCNCACEQGPRCRCAP